MADCPRVGFIGNYTRFWVDYCKETTAYALWSNIHNTLLIHRRYNFEFPVNEEFVLQTLLWNILNKSYHCIFENENRIYFAIKNSVNE